MTIPQFIDERVNDYIEEVSLESVGGPNFSTTIVATSSGGEAANINWSQDRGRWEFGERQFDRYELRKLGSFFRRCHGKAVPFRFKDFSDFDTDEFSTGTMEPTEDPLVFELFKTYGGGLSSYSKRIYKPVVDTVTVYVDGVEVEAIVDGHDGTVTFEYAIGAGVPTWDGEFDIPVRFDADGLMSRFDAYDEDGDMLFWVFSLPVIEIRPDEDFDV